jgi:hypothetical protein
LGHISLKFSKKNWKISGIFSFYLIQLILQLFGGKIPNFLLPQQKLEKEKEGKPLDPKQGIYH